MRIDNLDTPAVLVDLDIMERNLARLSAYAREKGLALRPHTKTHKIPEIARLQIEGGAAGVTVAKPGEARVMIEGGVNDVMIAYPLVTPAKAQAAAELGRGAQVRVSVDSVDAVRALGEAAAKTGSRIGLLVEIDTGFHRCGVAAPDEAIALAAEAQRFSHLEFLGLMFYPGHLGKPPGEQAPMIAEVNRVLERFLQAFKDAAIPVQVVSGGSTPTAFRSHEFPEVTEIRPGMYIFNDANLVRMGVAHRDDCAVHVLVTVASTAVAGRAILDGGSKTFSSDRSKGERTVFGIIREDEAAEFYALSEEHGHVDISKAERKFRVGDRLRVLPNHVCTTINMHDRIYGVRGGSVERIWDVAARGKVQ